MKKARTLEERMPPFNLFNEDEQVHFLLQLYTSGLKQSESKVRINCVGTRLKNEKDVLKHGHGKL